MSVLSQRRRAIISSGGRSVIDEGQCGANAFWKLYSDGTLEISGTGNIYTYWSASEQPWYEYKDEILATKILYGITSTGNNFCDSISTLTSVEIPNSVTNIGQYSFNGCTALTSVEIPNSVTNIGQYSFNGCSNIETVNFIGDIDEWNTLCGINSGIGKNGKSTKVLMLNGEILTHFELETSTTINAYAFSFANVESVEIPNSVTSINTYAFFNCRSLTSITIPNSVTSIGGDAFRLCISLTSVEIPNSVTSIANGVFSDCTALTSIEIPNSVKSIGNRAFFRCTMLNIVVFRGIPTSINASTFIEDENLNEMYCPWEENAVANAPWGAKNATIHYNTAYDTNGNPIA